MQELHTEVSQDVKTAHCKQQRNHYASLDIQTAKERGKRPEPPFGTEREPHMQVIQLLTSATVRSYHYLLEKKR